MYIGDTFYYLNFLALYRQFRFIISKYVKEFDVYIVRARSYISEYGRTTFSSSCYQSRKRAHFS